MPTLSQKSLGHLTSCHDDLQRLFLEVVKHRDCAIICGWRSEAEQGQAFDSGKSKLNWPNSKHNYVPSLGVDAVPYQAVKPHIRWEDIQSFVEFGNFVLGVAAVMKIEVVWGGNWKTFKDYPHFELKIVPEHPVFVKC